MPTPDSGDDFVWVCGPGEGFGVVVGVGDEAVDGGLKIYHATEDTALQSLLGKFGEEPLDCIEPRARGWREVKGEARVAGEPLAHLGMLVDGVIVEDHVNELSGRHLRLNSIQKADELLVPVALHTSADDLAFEHVESSEKRRCAVALVVVGHRAGATFLHRQAGLGAVEGLDLRLLIDRKHDGVGGRIDIEPDNIEPITTYVR